MPILTTVRQSPAYLYAKTYVLCALVTLFQAAPVTSTLPVIKSKLPLRLPRKGKTLLREKGSPSIALEKSQRILGAHSNHEKPGTEAGEVEVPPSYVVRVLGKWWRRTVDLAQIKKHLRQDAHDIRRYPEVAWDASVRCSSEIHPKEKKFIETRRARISSRGANSLHSFLSLSHDEKVDPHDVPLVALGGSGGGYRAMYGFTSFISASKKLGLWDCLTWTAGVSGSCWTLAAYYTLGYHDSSRLTKHYLRIAQERAHPLSVQALNTVARSTKGIYFLLGPLIRKARSGIIGLGVMDLYATLTTTYQFLSREPGARLSRATFQFSKVWERSELDQGAEPMPFLTAVRRAPADGTGVRPHADSSISKGRPPSRALRQHETDAHKRLNRSSTTGSQPITPGVPDSTLPNGFFQWFEVSPLEVGSPDAQAYIPTWAWGRTFVSGRSFGRPPEQSLALILGQCTSAPAGPLTGYVSALLASLPRGTWMSRILLICNDFLRIKRWEKRWGNPIRAGHDPNPFYGAGRRPDYDSQADPTTWELQGRVRLMDSGMSNNLPNHILGRPARGAEVIVAFDASSDVQTGSAVRRIQYWADECRIQIQECTEDFVGEGDRTHFQMAEPFDAEAAAVEQRFWRDYTKVFKGEREDGRSVYLVYCPLLPNGVNPDFDPSKASFSTSYNLVWTPEQMKMLFATTEANLSLYAIDAIRKVMKQVYLANKARREAQEISSIPTCGRQPKE